MNEKRSLLSFIIKIFGYVALVPVFGIPFGILAIIIGFIELIRIYSGKSVGPKSDVFAGMIFGFFGALIGWAIYLGLAAK